MSGVLNALLGSYAARGGAFESIASATGTGSSANILFSSIPQTYAHLQLRILGRSDDTSNSVARTAFVQCNNDFPTTNIYSYHELIGNGSSVSATAAPFFPISSMQATGTSQSTSSSIMGALIMDIHDYTSTSRFKTMRTFGGVDFNGGGSIAISSGLYQSTDAITQLRVSINTSNWSTNTIVALYGIKAA